MASHSHSRLQNSTFHRHPPALDAATRRPQGQNSRRSTQRQAAYLVRVALMLRRSVCRAESMASKAQNGDARPRCGATGQVLNEVKEMKG
eukprot:1119985-Prorocentrum_minimum.AAC.4